MCIILCSLQFFLYPFFLAPFSMPILFHLTDRPIKPEADKLGGWWVRNTVWENRQPSGTRTLQCSWLHLQPKEQHAALQEWCHTEGSGELAATSTLDISVKFVWTEQSKEISPVKIQKSFTLEKFLDGVCRNLEYFGIFHPKWKMSFSTLCFIPNKKTNVSNTPSNFGGRIIIYLALYSIPLIG